MRGVFFLSILFLFGCATTTRFPCQDGGQPARAVPISFKVIKSCNQKKDASGKYVNQGKYYEYYYENEKIALEGQYENGKKVGRWIEYDMQRNKISDEVYQDGKRIDLSH